MADSRSETQPFSAAAERNAAPILEQLREVLATTGSLLELASGTGQHAVTFAQALPKWQWQPSDVSEAALDAIGDRVARAGLPNLHAPVRIDVERLPWPVARFDAVYAANMMHISPWRACLGLLEGAATVLSRGAPLILYGPFLRDDVETAASNLAFDADLKRRNPAWGIRRLQSVTQVADVAGFAMEKVVEMPANNLLLVFRRHG